MTTHSVAGLLKRLSKAGFKRDFVRPAILPDWWDDSLESDETVLVDLELRVARFLGAPLADVRNPKASLAAQTFPSTVLRKGSSVDAAALRPAIHAARRVAEAVCRNMHEMAVREVPADPSAWRHELLSHARSVTLETLLQDLWHRGIPVIPMERLPAPSFQGMAAVVDGRPIIVIGQKYEAPARVAFFVAHEAGHIAAGDCKDGEVIVDQQESADDSSDIEIRADEFASRVLLGGTDPNGLSGDDHKDLALSAYEIEQGTGTDAGALLFHWARQHNKFSTATMAVAALYKDAGARQLMADFLAKNVNVDDAPETDRALIGLVARDSQSSPTTG